MHITGKRGCETVRSIYSQFVRPSNSRHSDRLDENGPREQCINTGTRCIMHYMLAPLAFLEYDLDMGVSSNQRPIRVVHASHCLRNAVLSIVITMLYPRTRLPFPLAEAAEQMSRTFHPIPRYLPFSTFSSLSLL